MYVCFTPYRAADKVPIVLYSLLGRAKAGLLNHDIHEIPFSIPRSCTARIVPMSGLSVSIAFL